MSFDIKDGSCAREPEQPIGAPVLYEHVLAEFHLGSVSEAAAKADKSSLVAWLDYIGKGLTTPVGSEFNTAFEATLNNFMNDAGKNGRAVKTVQNMSSRLKGLHKSYLGLAAIQPNPIGFLETIQERMRLKGITLADVSRDVGRSAYNWARGQCLPRKRDMISLVHTFETYLDLPKDTLFDKLWNTKKVKVFELNADIPYRRYLNQVKKEKFRLPKDDIPASLLDSIEMLFAHKAMRDHMLPSGELVSLKNSQIWSSGKSADKQWSSLASFYGFLALPKQPSASKPNWLESLRYGQGLDPSTFRLTMLVQIAYVYPFMMYSELRSFDKEHYLAFEASQQDKSTASAPTTLRKSLSESFLNTFLGLSNNLLNSKTSFFRLHPEFGQELSPPVPPELWDVWCDARQKELAALTRSARLKVQTGKRSNKEVLGLLLREKNPAAIYHQIIASMKRDLPPDATPVSQAAHWRDLTIVAFMLFDPLRAKNICLLDLGKHLIKESSGKWRLRIARGEFKNSIHEHAEERDRLIPDDIGELMDKWVNVYRPHCHGHKKTNAFFINIVERAPRKNNTRERWTEVVSGDDNRMTPVHLRRCFVVHTKDYMGVGVGPHALRTLMATTIAKMGGTPSQIKAILNDSEAVANTIYKDVHNIDEMDALDSLYEKAKRVA